MGAFMGVWFEVSHDAVVPHFVIVRLQSIVCNLFDFLRH